MLWGIRSFDPCMPCTTHMATGRGVISREVNSCGACWSAEPLRPSGQDVPSAGGPGEAAGGARGKGPRGPASWSSGAALDRLVGDVGASGLGAQRRSRIWSRSYQGSSTPGVGPEACGLIKADVYDAASGVLAALALPDRRVHRGEGRCEKPGSSRT